MTTIPTQTCFLCLKDSGTKLICDECFPSLSKSQRQSLDRSFQLAIIELFGRKCVDCGFSAEADSGELCADHLQQKLTDPLARYDLANAVCRCAACHRGRHDGSVPRVPKKAKLPKETQLKQEKVKKLAVCKIAGCPLWAGSNGKCWKHA